MKFSCYWCAPIILLFSLSGCGESESTSTKQNGPGTAKTESVFDPMVQTIDKAKSVEDLSTNRSEELDKELEKSQ